MARTDARSHGGVSMAARDEVDAPAPWSGWSDVAVDLPSADAADEAVDAHDAEDDQAVADSDGDSDHDSDGDTEDVGRASKASKAGQGRSSRRFRVVAVTAVVLVAAALAAAVTAVVLFVHGRMLESNREGALAAGRQAAVNLTSVNYNTADADVRRVLDSATGDFAALFEQNLDSYTGIVRDGRVVSTGDVAGIGVDRVDSSSAHVIAAVNSKVQNSQLPNGESRNYRMSMDMVLGEDGVWRVAKMEFIP